MPFDIIIIGAGAAGLMAARDLSRSGQRLCVIEADDRAGGRINTMMHNGEKLELGAEFVHGKSPVTDELLKEIGIEKEKVEGKMIPVHKGVWFGENALMQNSELLTEKLGSLDSDMTIQEFLDKHFPQHEYEELRDSVIQFSEGFSLADVQKASVFALKKEWSQIESDQYRVNGGYQAIIDHLYNECTKKGVSFSFGTKVNEVECLNDRVMVTTADGTISASQVIVTCSVGVLQSNELRLMPAKENVNTAITQMAFGSVIKILFLFKKPFWLTKDEDLGFILSDEEIPTWWTQQKGSKLLTGWLGGTKAERFSNYSESVIMKAAMHSLSNIFEMKERDLVALLDYHKIVCWNKRGFVKGGYSYTSIFTEEGRKALQEPMHGRIYFAGEAMYAGEIGGTVEAALASGVEVAKKIRENKVYGIGVM